MIERAVALIFIFTLLSGLQISLETEKLAYLPLEQVKVKAVVTYNGYPLQNQLIAFQLISPNDTTLDIRTFITDEKGQATYLVRLPYDAQPGLWTVTATTNIGEIKATSYAQFFVPTYNITVNTEILPLWLKTLIALACTLTIITSTIALYRRWKGGSPQQILKSVLSLPLRMRMGGCLPANCLSVERRKQNVFISYELRYNMHKQTFGGGKY